MLATKVVIFSALDISFCGKYVSPNLTEDIEDDYAPEEGKLKISKLFADISR